ncbi:E3 ubiquitin ligase complex SCF subunit scon-3 [Jackrogersella minutella]|nr:E3 ubiquitin ligase complex SCF subunit scon-3 [Jackrogersella minutella]
MAAINTRKLVSCDGVTVTISREAAKQSQVFKDMIEDLPEEAVGWGERRTEEEQEKEAALWKEPKDKLKGEATKDHGESSKENDNSRAIASSSLPQPTEIPAQEKEFFASLNQQELFELILAANFFEIQLLLECTSITIAEHIKDMSTAQMREYFGIENDFTLEEEHKLRVENQWVDDTKHINGRKLRFLTTGQWPSGLPPGFQMVLSEDGSAIGAPSSKGILN